MTLIRVLLLLTVLIALLFITRPDDALTAEFVARADAYRATFLYRLANDYNQLAITRQPWNATLYLRASALALDRGRVDEAAQQLDRAQQLGAQAMAVDEIKAAIAEQSHRFDEAAQQWSLIAQARPVDQAAMQRTVRAYVNAEKWDEARSAAEQWVKRWPDSAEAHFALAKVIALDDPIVAKDHFDHAPPDQAQEFLPALNETDPALRAVRLGRAYLSNNEVILAQRAFDAAVKANENYAEAYAYLGFTLDQSGRDGKAMLDRAVELDRDLIVARYFRARHAWAQGDLDGALNDLKYANERDPQNRLIVAELGRLYMQRGDLALAEQWLIKARDLNADDPVAWQALAELYVGRAYGSPEQANSVAQQAVKLAPDDAGAHVWLGVAYLLNGDRSNAEQELLRAEALSPRLALTHLYLGRLYGRSTEAGQLEYERALELDRDGPIGAQAKRALELP